MMKRRAVGKDSNKRKKKEEPLEQLKDEGHLVESRNKHSSPRKKNKKEGKMGASASSSDEEEAYKTEEKEELNDRMMEGKESDEEDTSFLLLPDELWLMIFSELTLVEKSRCSLVCHHFWKWSTDRILYRTLDFSPYAERMGSFRISSFASLPKTVNAEVINLKGCKNITDTDIEFITSRWHKLSVINLEGCTRLTRHSIRYIDMRCTMLKALNIIGCNIMEFNSVLKLLQSRKQPIDLQVTSHTHQGCTYPQFRSLASEIDTAITFSNQTDKPAEIVWVDFEGDTRVYHRLNPGRFYSQHTFETHYWLMREYQKPENVFLHTVGTARPHVAEAIDPRATPKSNSKTTTIRSIGLSSVAAPMQLCVPTGVMYSIGEKLPVTITFKNGSDDTTYLLYWIGKEGEEIFKGEVGPTQDMKFDSFTSHIWRVKEKMTLDIFTEVVLTAESLDVHL